MMDPHKLTPTELIKECCSLIQQLRNHCVVSMHNREFSQIAKHPFKIMSFVNAMCWRMFEISKGAIKLIRGGLIIPSSCLIRAAWENMVVTYELTTLMKECCQNESIKDNTDDVLMRILFSNRFDKDNRFVGEDHYDEFKDYKAKNILTLVDKVEKEYPHTKDIYKTICEFVHPNGDGVTGSYSKLNEEKDETYFGPQIDRHSVLFPVFVSTLSCSLILFLQFVDSIEGTMKEFTRICEESLNRRIDTI